VQLLGHARYAAKIAMQAHLTPPEGGGRLRRFAWGFALPFGVVRAAFRDHAVRSHWLRWTSLQLAVLLVIGVRIGLARSDLTERGVRPTLAAFAAFATASYAALTVVEWILIALSRDYHDALSQMAAATTGVVAEPLLGPPRIRLDFGWLWVKLKRRIRGLWLLGTALPVIAWALLIPAVGEEIYVGLMTAWTAYWLAVFAIGGSFVAWESAAPGSPWFVRMFAAAGRVPVLGIPPRLYARFLARATRSVTPVCAVFERDPWAAAGLALARGIAGIPGVYLFFRPAFSVAATHTILGYGVSITPRLPDPPPPATRPPPDLPRPGSHRA
jgi:hypothetical protein